MVGLRFIPTKDEVQGLWDHAFSLRRRFRQTGFRLARHMRPERPLTRLVPPPPPPPAPPVNWIGKLHELYQKKLGMDRQTQKQEIRFTTEKRPGNGIHQLMFQSTVHAQEFRAGPFVGDEPTRKNQKKRAQSCKKDREKDREESQSYSEESEESEKRVKTEKSGVQAYEVCKGFRRPGRWLFSSLGLVRSLPLRFRDATLAEGQLLPKTEPQLVAESLANVGPKGILWVENTGEFIVGVIMVVVSMTACWFFERQLDPFATFLSMLTRTIPLAAPANVMVLAKHKCREVDDVKYLEIRSLRR
eukprot:s433_g16.t1